MRDWLGMLCVVMLLSGCGTGKNIVSPSASEEDIRARASAVTSEKTSSAKEERELPPRKSPEKPQEAVKSGKTNAPEERIMKGGCREEALINLLIRKGIITEKELSEEMKMSK